MSNKNIDFIIKDDNTHELLQEEEIVIKTILELIGMQVQGAAVSNITKNKSVDTGLLRNSIAYGLDGEQMTTGSYKGTDKHARTYKADKANDKGEIAKGKYVGNMPKEKNGNRAVYIGTNVEYAPYVEFGTYKQNAKPYLRPAVEQSQDKIKEIISKGLGK